MSTVRQSQKTSSIESKPAVVESASTSPVETVDSTTSDESNETLDDAVSDEDKPQFFQAIGTLYGQPHKNEEEKFFLQVGGQEYPLFIRRDRYSDWLKQMTNFPDTPLFLRVYPKCVVIPREEPKIYFQVVAWVTENRWDEAPGIFIIKGIWQFIPQLRTPVLSVYRNREAHDPTGKFKALHLPVLMRREDEAKPFRFNPKIPKDQLPQRWFIQGHFKFIPNRNCWGWVKDLDVPSEQIPRYKKPIKAPVENEKPPEKNVKSDRAERPDKPEKIEKPTKINKKG